MELLRFFGEPSCRRLPRSPAEFFVQVSGELPAADVGCWGCVLRGSACSVRKDLDFLRWVFEIALTVEGGLVGYQAEEESESLLSSGTQLD